MRKIGDQLITGMKSFYKSNNCYMSLQLVGNKAKERISKRVFPNNPKNKHFLPSDTRTYVCVSGVKKSSFFGKFGVLCILETPILRFTLLAYYRQTIEKTLNCHLYTARRFPEETLPFFILEYYGELSFEIYLRSVFERRLLRMNFNFDDIVLNRFILKNIVKICPPLNATIYRVPRSYFRHSTYQETISCDVQNTMEL